MTSRAALVTLVAVLLTFAASTWLRADPVPGRGRWEYRVERLPADLKDADVARVLGERLEKATAEGFEYAGWVTLGGTYVLRRAR